MPAWVGHKRLVYWMGRELSLKGWAELFDIDYNSFLKRYTRTHNLRLCVEAGFRSKGRIETPEEYLQKRKAVIRPDLPKVVIERRASVPKGEVKWYQATNHSGYYYTDWKSENDS